MSGRNLDVQLYDTDCLKSLPHFEECSHRTVIVGITVMVDFVRHGSHPEEEDPGWKWYIRSLYWMLTTASTIGFGDIVPVNLVEVILSLICTFCGTFLLAIVLCQLSAGVTSLQKSRLEYLYRLKGDVVSIGKEVFAQSICASSN